MKQFIGKKDSNSFLSGEFIQGIIRKASKIKRRVFTSSCNLAPALAGEFRSEPTRFDFYRNGEIMFYFDAKDGEHYFYM